MTHPILQVKGLRAGYGRAEVLHGIDLHADKGSVITVIGPNGAGKSTLLNTLMGVIPSHGILQFDGRDVGALPLEERVMLGMALVPEKRELFGSMPVEDNLLLGGYRQMRLGDRQWRLRLDDVYAIFPRLQERRMQLAGTLSGGERQMLAVGRALMSRPRLLMLDEPSLGLAPLVVREIYPDANASGSRDGTILPGYHGKGLYAGQGRVVYANNGESTKEARVRPDVEQLGERQRGQRGVRPSRADPVRLQDGIGGNTQDDQPGGNQQPCRQQVAEHQSAERHHGVRPDDQRAREQQEQRRGAHHVAAQREDPRQQGRQRNHDDLGHHPGRSRHARCHHAA